MKKTNKKNREPNRIQIPVITESNNNQRRGWDKEFKRVKSLKQNTIYMKM
jgi:hypothetical protein